MTGQPRPGHGPPPRPPVSDAGIDDVEPVRAEISEPDHDEAAFGSGAGADAGAAGEGAGVAGAAAGSANGESTAGGDDDGFDRAAAAVLADLEQMSNERQKYLELAQRTQADLDNFRKQAQKRQDDAVQRALERLVGHLLPVLDACDAAVAHGAGEAVEPVVGALFGALEKEGLERIDPTGERFDPTEAEAVMHEPGDGGEQVVAEVMRAGYRWQGRVLRPAMVKVTD